MVVIRLNIQDTNLRENMDPENNNYKLTSQSEIVLLNLPFVL